MGRSNELMSQSYPANGQPARAGPRWRCGNCASLHSLWLGDSLIRPCVPLTGALRTIDLEPSALCFIPVSIAFSVSLQTRYMVVVTLIWKWQIIVHCQEHAHSSPYHTHPLPQAALFVGTSQHPNMHWGCPIIPASLAIFLHLLFKPPFLFQSTHASTPLSSLGSRTLVMISSSVVSTCGLWSSLPWRTRSRLRHQRFHSMATLTPNPQSNLHELCALMSPPL